MESNASATLSKRKNDERGSFGEDEAGIGGDWKGILFAVIGVVIVAGIVAGVAATYFQSLEDINTNLTAADTGSTVANDIAAIFPILVGVLGVLALVSLVLAAFARVKG